MLKLVIDTIISPVLLIAAILAGIATAFAVWTSGDSTGMITMYFTAAFAVMTFAVIVRLIDRQPGRVCK